MDGTQVSVASFDPVVDGCTERFDSIACVDDRFRRASRGVEPGRVEPDSPGRYIEIQGPNQRLLIELADEVTHIGRGLAANLHLDDSSVSRRHAVLVQRLSGHRILDDRSFNGTFVNGRRTEQSDLCNGDIIMLGRVMLRYLDV